MHQSVSRSEQNLSALRSFFPSLEYFRFNNTLIYLHTLESYSCIFIIQQRSTRLVVCVCIFYFIAFRKTANEGELSKVKQLDANNRKTNKFKNKRFIIKVVFTVKLVVEQKSKGKTCNKKITVEEDSGIPLLAQVLLFASLFALSN